MKKIYKKLILVILIVGVSYGSLLNCFGKFSLTRKLYQVVDGLKIGSGKVQKVVQTLVLYLCLFTFIAGITFFIDFIILNLIEFWMDKNPLGLNEYNKEGLYVKKFQKGGNSIELKYSNFGSRLDVKISDGKKIDEFVVLNGEPGKIFKEEEGTLKEIQLSSNVVGQKMLIKMAKNGKLESSKVMNIKDYQDINRKILAGTL
ncbi:MAG: DUF3332 family protein [Leptospiraceae bacterium]|nr:DUF3332 family protein [Leptospiraceae bacterium]MCP5497062.1 DUF3332 family protein [Leptospiraceae bacterium]